jgi:hypothetical protein
MAMNPGRQSLPCLPRSSAHPVHGLAMALMIAVAGCSGGSRQGRAPATPRDVAAPPPASAPASQAAAPQLSKDKELATEGSPATSGDGAITRKEMRKVIAGGAQAFIQQVQIRPAFRNGQFYGWRVVEYRGPGPVRAGDIVRRVNGQSLERPEQFMKAWDGLARRSSLVLEMVRRGRALVLRWSIIE